VEVGVARVNILKQVKSGDRWRLVAIPRNKKGDYDWQALPEGRYFVEWYERGKRKREAGGGTAAEVLETARRRRHVLEGRALNLIKDPDGEEAKKTTVHVAVNHYLESIEALKKPNTYRKYKAVLDRFVEFLPASIDPRKITSDQLTDFMVKLNNKHKLDNNTVIHQSLGSVDVALEKGGRRIACEVSVTTDAEHELGNVQKCLAAGFETVILVRQTRKFSPLRGTRLCRS
jgi:hypothetical protein